MPHKPVEPRQRMRFLARHNHLTSVLLILPLLLLYEVGVLFTDVMNGADFLTQALLQAVGLKGFLLIQGGTLAVFIGVVFYLRRSQSFRISAFIPVILESAIYALTMGTFILFVMTDVLHIDPHLSISVLSIPKGMVDRLVLSLGAGVYEELVFRLMLLGGLALMFERAVKLRRWLSVLLALFISSVVFSLAHHVGAMGEPFRLGVFVYRMIAGVFFGVLYRFRGLSVAVYTHAIYDIYVLLLSQ